MVLAQFTLPPITKGHQFVGYAGSAKFDGDLAGKDFFGSYSLTAATSAGVPTQIAAASVVAIIPTPAKAGPLGTVVIKPKTVPQRKR